MTQVLENGRNGHHEEESPRSDFERMINRPFAARPPSEVLSDSLGVPKEELIPTLRRQVMPRGSTTDDFMAFLQIAAKYLLNPFTREIYAMAKKGGGVQVIVGIDGWVAIVQRNKKYDGVEFHEVAGEDGRPILTTCTMYVKGQGHPVVVAERFAECRRGTEPWVQMPFRMLRHKAYIQAARLAFGINGIADEDEGSKAAGYESVEEALRASAAAIGNDPKKEANPFAHVKTDEEDNDSPAGGEDAPSFEGGEQAASVPTEAPAPAAPAQAPTKTNRPSPKAKTAPAPVEAPVALDDGPTSPKDIADVYVATKNRTECRQFIDTVNATTPAIVTAAKKLAGVLNLDHADDEEMHNVAWNVKFALEGGNEQ